MGKTAIVTGASSGIGHKISKTLCCLGYEVFGIGRSFEASETKNCEEDRFYPVVCDILDTNRLADVVKKIAANGEVSVLVNNAGCAYYGLHEELNPKKIQQMVRTNLEAPMILTQLLLRQLKANKGYVINISSVTAISTNPHGCAYGATKAGLSGFTRSLFEEARKYGVKAVTISPDMTDTNLYRNADFGVGEETESYLLPEEVAGAVEFVLSQREGAVVTEITLKPQLHRIRRN